jgi:hypothetical protein
VRRRIEARVGSPISELVNQNIIIKLTALKLELMDFKIANKNQFPIKLFNIELMIAINF